MVAKVNLSEEQLKNLYFEVKEKTKKFKEIKPEVIAENCQRIVIFRLALGLSVEQFANICKRSGGSIDNLQRSPKKINFGVAEYYTEIIKNLLNSTDFRLESVLERYRLFYGRAIKGVKILPEKERKQFAKIGAQKSLEKRKSNEFLYFKASKKGVERQQLTKQEKKIKKLLDKKHMKYETHRFLGNENVDFLLNDKIAVGCACGKEKNLTHHARRLMYQAYRIKYYNKNIVYVGVLGNYYENLKKENLPLGTTRLLNEICDAWFVDENINQIIMFIAGSLTSPPSL